jgi:hypothetical protein
MNCENEPKEEHASLEFGVVKFSRIPNLKLHFSHCIQQSQNAMSTSRLQTWKVSITLMTGPAVLQLLGGDKFDNTSRSLDHLGTRLLSALQDLGTFHLVCATVTQILL